MEIQLGHPRDEGYAVLDTQIAEVTLLKVFNGVTLKSADGELLSICMRDSGFEVIYSKEFSTLNPFNSGTIEFKNGKVNRLMEVE